MRRRGGVFGSREQCMPRAGERKKFSRQGREGPGRICTLFDVFFPQNILLNFQAIGFAFPILK